MSLSNDKLLVLFALAAHRPTWTTRHLARLLQTSSATVSYWLRNRRKQRAVHKAPAVSSKKLLLRRKRLLVLLEERHPNNSRQHPSCRSLVTALRVRFKTGVSRATAASDLRALGYVSRVRPKTTLLDAAGDRARRLQWCQRHVAMTKRTNDKLVFCDEKIFTTNDFSHRREWVRRGERPSGRVRARWPEARVHVFAAIGIGFRSITILPAKRPGSKASAADDKQIAFRLTKESYIRRCLAPMAARLADEDRILVQDGAGCHKAALKYLADKGIELLADWPARSPDLNVIENLWHIMASDVSIKFPTCRTTLVSAIRAAFNDISEAYIKELVLSFPGRCREVVKRGGDQL